MILNHRRPFLYLALLTLVAACTSTPLESGDGAVTEGSGNELLFRATQNNSSDAAKKPYVILVSIDGYRSDYNKLYNAKNLETLAATGVRAESLRPVYPSKTFPNHYSIITGLRADRHGIVSNEFYDPARDQVYAISDRKAVEDGSWYAGEPIWITAQRQGMLTASYYWVGSEAGIQGMHPNYFFRYDEGVSAEKRVDQVLAWLELSDERRPHFITLYFEEVDTAGHRFGPRSKEVQAAVTHVDEQIGRLAQEVKKTGLPINIVVVSDHGMQQVDAQKMVAVDESDEAKKILKKFRIHGRGPQMQLYLKSGESAELIEQAKKILTADANKPFRVYKRSEMNLQSYSASPRAGDLVIDANGGFSIGLKDNMPSSKGGNHGWDPKRLRSMDGIFIASGPSFAKGATVPTFDNVHIYPLLLEALGLKQTTSVDGQLEIVRPALATPSR